MEACSRDVSRQTDWRTDRQIFLQPGARQYTCIGSLYKTRNMQKKCIGYLSEAAWFKSFICIVSRGSFGDCRWWGFGFRFFCLFCCVFILPAAGGAKAEQAPVFHLKAKTIKNQCRAWTTLLAWEAQLSFQKTKEQPWDSVVGEANKPSRSKTWTTSCFQVHNQRWKTRAFYKAAFFVPLKMRGITCWLGLCCFYGSWLSVGMHHKHTHAQSVQVQVWPLRGCGFH